METMTQRVTGEMHATTILAVRRGADVAMAGDGQVTVGDVVMKHTARKIRRLANGAGSTNSRRCSNATRATCAAPPLS